MQLVLHDGAAHGRTELLIVDRLHALQDGVFRGEPAVAEVAAEQPGDLIGAGFGHRIHLHARRPAHRRVEPVRDELEFRDRILAGANSASAIQLRPFTGSSCT